MIALRARQQRNFLTTLLLSQGIPMIAHGDELGRGQQGNNNVYCQDNELAWVDWDLDKTQEELLAFARRVVALPARGVPPAPLPRRHRPGEEGGLGDVAWFNPSGEAMTDTDWNEGHARSMMVFGGDAIWGPTPVASGSWTTRSWSRSTPHTSRWTS